MNFKLILCLALVLSGNCGAAIIFPKAPEGGRQIAYEGVDRRLRAFPRFLGGLQIAELTIADPYRDYIVWPTNVLAGQWLSDAKTGGWRYLLMDGTNAVGAAVLIADKKTGNALKFTALDQTDFSIETLKALRIAAQLPPVKTQDYEFRRLDSTPILFVAVWLHGKSDDIIIPLPPTFGRWNAYQPYSESQMIKLLQPEVKKKMKEPAGMVD